MGEAQYQKTLDNKLRTFANLIIDRILDDYKNDRLNYVIKSSNIVIDGVKRRLQFIVPINLTVTVKRKLVFSKAII